MNNQPKHTKAIVLARTNYGESDRIVKLLTRDYGKIAVIAKGVRKERSKLAGGIELFSVSDIGFILGKSDLATLVSSRLVKHYDAFLNDLEKVNFGYACLKSINKITADAADKHYFLLAEQLMQALNQPEMPLSVISAWWYLQISQLTGHTINTSSLVDGQGFKDGQAYIFDVDHGGFILNENGDIKPNHVKFLRLCQNQDPKLLAKVQGGEELAEDLISYLHGFVEYVH